MPSLPSPINYFSSVEKINVYKGNYGYGISMVVGLNSSSIGDLQKSLEEHILAKPVLGKKLEMDSVDYIFDPTSGQKKFEITFYSKSSLQTHELAFVADRLRDKHVIQQNDRENIAKQCTRLLKFSGGVIR